MYNIIIMGIIRYAADALEGFFQKKKVATMAQLIVTLGSPSKITVIRKLKSLAYLTSYTHAGKYYTLPDIARFNENGLWRWKDARFSKDRTLKRTLESWVGASPSGYVESDLEKELHVVVRAPLLSLLREGRLHREKIAGRYVYCSTDATLRLRQVLARHDHARQAGLELPELEALQHEVKAAIVLFFGQLNERQRRLYAGLESLKQGRGGDQRIAELLRLDPGTIARGREELLKRDVEIERIRKAGGGRHPLEKKIS